MTYGRGRRDLITRDDAAGVSLRRPRAGWLEATGSLWGAVLDDDGTRRSGSRPSSPSGWKMGNRPRSG